MFANDSVKCHIYYYDSRAAVSVAESYYYNVTTTTGFFCVSLIPVVQLWYWPLFITFDHYGLQIHWYQLFVIVNSNTNENCTCAVVIDQTIYPQYSLPPLYTCNYRYKMNRNPTFQKRKLLLFHWGAPSDRLMYESFFFGTLVIACDYAQSEFSTSPDCPCVICD